ncbi:MAG: hypothetical protein C3F12_03470 [Candidatus Methylomirabilota bacterium]|nr:hypothetical protein [candidate division NC10 bacterium]PWB47755.1 MAG: hypothetical protein C3F12_03470 [candidate division NC10 bacterium]
MYWTNFVHIYQPPTQTPEILERVTNECYRPLVAILLRHPHARLTLNINGCLTEQLVRGGYQDVIDGLGELAARGQIEFTGSAMYHPILPLIPEAEAVRQIELNTAANRRYLGNVYRPQGFFSPEMCYSRGVAEMVHRLGYRWIVVDEIGYCGTLDIVRPDRLYRVRGLRDFHVFFKERSTSAGITYGRFPTGEKLLRHLGAAVGHTRYLLTGTDGEVYGHHRKGQEQLLIDIFTSRALDLCRLSDLFTLFEEEEEVDPLPCSWSTWEDEMAAAVPYPQWAYPDHDLHRAQWALTRLAIDALTSVDRSAPGYEAARHYLDEGLHSCQYWWASCRPWWDTGMIERGAALLRRAVEAVQSQIAPELVSRTAVLEEEIRKTARTWHESGKAHTLRRQYLETHSGVGSLLTFG